MSVNDGPEYSPWGEVQNCETLCAGAYQVSTASHGGVMVSIEIVNDVLSPEARKCGFQENGYLCFEEDCDAPVALRELMDKDLFKAPVNDHFKPGEYSQIIDGLLKSRKQKRSDKSQRTLCRASENLFELEESISWPMCLSRRT